MLAKSFTALAAFALAVNAAAEPKPYKPLMKMSVKQLFGVVRRQDNPGYQPEQAVCGDGNTCEEACGAGYTECASKDLEIHCYNSAAQTCCPNKSGNSCDAGYYCTADSDNETWCCPEGMDLAACAAAYDIPGGLVSQTYAPTSSLVPSSSSSSAVPTSYPAQVNSTTSYAVTSASSTATVIPSQGYPSLNVTSATFVAPTPSAPAPPSTTDKVEEGAGSALAPATALFIVAAGFAALL
ncbi:hypothetical protein V8F20_005523 [Naviculisporaceae sp. PSN 640]